MSIASRTTVAIVSTTSNDPVLISNGDPFIVHGFTMISASNRLFELKRADFATNNTTLATIRVLANTTVVVDIPFIADHGLAISCTAGSAVAAITVYHDHPGR